MMFRHVRDIYRHDLASDRICQLSAASILLSHWDVAA